VNSSPVVVRPRSPQDAGGIPGAFLPIASTPKDMAALRKAAGEFETVFAKMFLSSMRKTAPQKSLFHGGRGEEIFTELLDTHYAEALSKRGKGLGIAEMIVRKYAAHVQADESEKGTVVDTNPAGAALPAGNAVGTTRASGVNDHD
jgi:Rod binding domain-containing protein